ncbi:hypothetical protein [Streptomyces sp. NPDC056512]|uniref:hypothetical protein n=1 Tax=Streptomyces sp. NPDC056512 TaxID=3345846 RepID=UPI0036C0207A
MTKEQAAVDYARSPVSHPLILLPYEQWITVSAAARRSGLSQSAVASVLRADRRRGVLRTRGKGESLSVMRICNAPRRRFA